MNKARDLYLKCYGVMYNIDQMLKDWGIDCICWWWWHAPMRHGKAITLCRIWQMYVECASGTVKPEQKVESPLSSPNFELKMEK